MGGRMDGRVGEWMDEWVDGWVGTLSKVRGIAQLNEL